MIKEFISFYFYNFFIFTMWGAKWGKLTFTLSYLRYSKIILLKLTRDNILVIEEYHKKLTI